MVRPTPWLLGVLVLGACGGDPAPPDELLCDPARGPRMTRFADVTRDSGLDFQYVTNDFKGGGLAVADLDGDGRPDVVAGRRVGGVTVFANRGALHFEAIAQPDIAATVAATAIAAADLDNDGDIDLVLASSGVAYVMANAGDGTFHEAARFDDSGTTEHALPADLDGDGLLDLYFSNYDLKNANATLNRLYMNRGGLQFADTGAVTADDGLSWTATAFDFDDDGDQDLYVASDTLLPDFGRPMPPSSLPLPVDLLLRNDGPGPTGVPHFTDVAAELGLASARSSMGGLLGDFDGDGRLDLYVPNLGAKKLFVRDALGGYAERAAQFGVAAIGRLNAGCGPSPASEDCLVLTWSAALGDFDLDGYDELLLINGETAPANTPPVLVFTRGPELPYHELSPDIACMDARGLVVTDLDGDGDQDLVIAPKEGALVIYENRGKPDVGASLQVELRGQASNRQGVGAIVTVRMTSGRTQTRAVGAGGVVHSASPAEAFFGLGSDVVDTLEVRWPSGRRTEVTRPAPGRLVVEETP